jgi:chitosanase
MKFSLLFVLTFIAFTAEAELTKEQKKRCEEYTSIFENDTIELQYAYVENIRDGRGYTAGRAGFTTGTADALEVIKKFFEFCSKFRHYAFIQDFFPAQE